MVLISFHHLLKIFLSENRVQAAHKEDKKLVDKVMRWQRTRIKIFIWSKYADVYNSASNAVSDFLSSIADTFAISTKRPTVFFTQ